MLEARRSEWQQRLREAVRCGDRDSRQLKVRQAVWSLRRLPGFRGIRQDAHGLIRLLQSDWQRVRHKGEPLPATPRLPPYLRRVRHR
ncbi:MAG: hypothetical protein VYB92_01305 [Pseudomonadota bacterium]|nr:hypothetical protein [Pseudomonadota bacterium]